MPTKARADIRVIAADDSPVISRLMEMVLRNLGVQREIAAKGYQAVRAYDREPADLVILDIQMPGFDGPATARLLRARPGGAAVKLIAMTGDTTPAVQALCHEAGFDEVWDKTLPPTRLAERISTVLETI